MTDTPLTDFIRPPTDLSDFDAREIIDMLRTAVRSHEKLERDRAELIALVKRMQPLIRRDGVVAIAGECALKDSDTLLARLEQK